MSVSDKEYYQLTISISKALHGIETPLKTKHARAAIIGTFYTHGAHSFWAISLRQPLQENRITAWKFCHLLHKVLREGHHLCCQQSMRHRSMLLEMGKLWGHLNDGYGLSIRHYTKLLVTKLEFHDRNPRIPGSLTLKRGELEAITGNDVNFYFQMAVEMFDYLDDVIALQATIFNSITTFHVNSMTSAGQCRLSPLIPLIQDSNQLYDFLVRIMFKLHGNLPNDVLQGHRDRFRAIFTQLKSFYGQSRNLQYFVNLITVPKLPEQAPNFGSQVDFGSYTAPVVVVPEPEPEPELVANLVDMSEEAAAPLMPPPRPASSATSNGSSSGHNTEAAAHLSAAAEAQVQDMKRIVQERDDLIRHLHVEVDRLGKCMKSLTVQTRDEHAHLEQQVATLNSQLSDAHEELINMRFVKEELELKAQSAEKQLVEEERHKASEEKFQKLKVMYGQIRDEHVRLLRQHGDVSKQLAVSTRTASDANRERDELRQQLDEQQQVRAKADEALQQSASTESDERRKLADEVLELSMENSALSAKLDDVQAHNEALAEELRAQLTAAEAKCSDVTEQLAGVSRDLEQEQHNSGELRRELTVLQSNQSRAEERLQQSAESAVREQNELADRVQRLETEKAELVARVETLEAEKAAGVDELRVVKEQLHQANEQAAAGADRAADERSAFESDMHDLLLEQETLTEQYTQSQANVAQLRQHVDDVRIAQEAGLRALIQTCIRASENLTQRAMSENDVAATSGTPSYFRMVAEELLAVLNEMVLVNAAYTNDADNNGEGLARKVILAGHLLATVHVQGMAVCNTCKDIEAGEKIADEIRAWSQLVADLYRTLHSGAEPAIVTAAIDAVRTHLQHLTTMIHDLAHTADADAAIADSIETELAGMDTAIEEAAARIEALLSQSRASDSGVKLEVNERILDACTALMNSIRLLVQRARALQAEIVRLGRGSASATEFYKRNHQWTEGLISAAKSVAQGANFLVSAANKAIGGGEPRDQLDLIVAAQEIAACTAQLVVSSRVKAPRGSVHLSELGQASRDVTQATGGVVATVKDSQRRLEDQQDLDLGTLSVHQAKTLEMEIQVKVLELEQALQMERMRLASFRRKNYRES